jgi:hypothetical protein
VPRACASRCIERRESAARQHLPRCSLSSRVAFFELCCRYQSTVHINSECADALAPSTWLGGQHGEESEEGKDGEEGEEGKAGQEEVGLTRRCDRPRRNTRRQHRANRRGRTAESAMRPRMIAPAQVDDRGRRRKPRFDLHERMVVGTGPQGLFHARVHRRDVCDVHVDVRTRASIRRQTLAKKGSANSRTRPF